MKRLTDWGALRRRLGPGRTVVLHTGCAEPAALAHWLAGEAASLKGTRVLSLMPMGDSPYAAEGPAGLLDVATFFPGRALRSALSAGWVRPLRHSLGSIPGLFERGELRANVLLLQVSPPDKDGHVSLGVAVDYMPAVLAQRPLVVAEINPRMPHTRGAARLPAEVIDWFIDGTEGPTEVPPAAADEIDRRIAHHVADLVCDGAVLQIGIGSLPDAVLGQLGHHKHLGLHTGIVTDACRPLIESGAIDNSTKALLPGVSVTTMAGGTQAFYDFLAHNADVEFHPCSLTHDVAKLATLRGLTAINGGLQVALDGQVNTEEIAGRKISMPGGLPDFCAGATAAPGGLSIVALRSTFGTDSSSNLVAALGAHTPASVGPAHVDFVVTEYGAARVRGLDPARRAAALVAIANPDHRDRLTAEFRSLGRQ